MLPTRYPLPRLCLLHPPLPSRGARLIGPAPRSLIHPFAVARFAQSSSPAIRWTLACLGPPLPRPTSRLAASRPCMSNLVSSPPPLVIPSLLHYLIPYSICYSSLSLASRPLLYPFSVSFSLSHKLALPFFSSSTTIPRTPPLPSSLLSPRRVVAILRRHHRCRCT